MRLLIVLSLPAIINRHLELYGSKTGCEETHTISKIGITRYYTLLNHLLRRSRILTHTNPRNVPEIPMDLYQLGTSSPSDPTNPTKPPSDPQAPAAGRGALPCPFGACAQSLPGRNTSCPGAAAASERHWWHSSRMKNCSSSWRCWWCFRETTKNQYRLLLVGG